MGMRSFTWIWAAVFLGLPAGPALAREEEPMKPIDEIFEPRGNFDPDRFVKVAVVQWVQTMPAPVGVTPAVAEEYKQENRLRLEEFIREAASNGVQWVRGLSGYSGSAERGRQLP